MSSTFVEMMDLALFDQKPGLVLVSEFPEEDDRRLSVHKPILDELFPGRCEVKVIPWGEQYLDAMEDEILAANPERLLLWPPFTNPRQLSPELRDRFGRLGVQEIALQIAVAKAAHGTSIGVILPRQSLIGYAPSRFRENVRKQTSLGLVITYDDFWDLIGWPAPVVQMGTLVLEVGAEADGVLRFFRCPSLSERGEHEIVSDLERLLRQGGGKTEFGYVLREAPRPDAPLSYDLHHPDLTERRDEMGCFGEVRDLRELVDIRRGLVPAQAKEDLLSGSGARGIPVLEGRDVRPHGTIITEDPRYRIEEPSSGQLKAGDICLRSVVSGSEGRLPVAEITEDMLPLAASSTITILRPKESTTEEDRQLLLAYLRSKRALEFLRARSTGLFCSSGVLAHLPVPVPDEAISLAIRGLREAGQQFSEWQEELNHERDSLFALFDAFPSAEKARMHLLSTGRVARRRVEAAARVTSFTHRVGAAFPHPIAYRWRVTQVRRRSLEGYQEVLECAEATLCYLACMAITLSRNIEGAEIGYLSGMTKRITEYGRGTNMGDWIAILREIRDSRKFRHIAELKPFFEVLTFLDEEVDEAVQDLKDRRDAYAHGRGPKGRAVEVAINEATSQLEVLMRSIEFCAEYPLRYIESTQRDSIRGVTQYKYRDLMGDHPLVSVQEGVSGSPDLEAGSLYLVDRSKSLHRVRPLLTRHYCEQCGRAAVFHLDRYIEGSDTAILKSLERGHTIEDRDIPQAFRMDNLLIE